MRVIDVHNITSANGWVFPDGSSVACFALVTTTNHNSPGMLQEKLVIPIRPEELQLNLLGMEVKIIDNDVQFVGEIG